MTLFSSFVLFLALFAVVILLKGVVIVQQGQEFTIERFGRYTFSLRPGLHFIVPVADRVGQRVNMMEQLVDVPSQQVITKDNAMVRVNGILFFQVVDSGKAAYEVENYREAISRLVMTNIRNELGGMELQETLSNRETITDRLMKIVDAATAPWGIKVTRVEIQDIEPPSSLTEAMARQITAEREKRAAILEAEGMREAAVRRAQGERESIIANAEGEKRQQILQAEGRLEAARRDAEARERHAEAEARATHMVSKALSSGNPQVLNYFVAQRYVDSMQQIASADNHKVVFMPLEASSLLGAVGGITELLQQGMAYADADKAAKAQHNGQTRPDLSSEGDD